MKTNTRSQTVAHGQNVREVYYEPCKTAALLAKLESQRDELLGLLREMSLYLMQLRVDGVRQPKIESLISEAQAAIANAEGSK